MTAGEQVREVPAFLTHRERKKAPSKGKSDSSDAIAIARVVVRGEGLVPVRVADIYQDLKLLSDARDALVRERTQLINRIHADLAVLVPGYEACLPKLTARAHIAKARRLLHRDQSVRARLIRDRLKDLDRLHGRVKETTRLLAVKVKESKTSLTSLRGISFVNAARILGELGDPARLRSKEAFAMFNGTAPLPASSGNTQRHRLNRGGNRQLNCAIHTMALTCARSDPRTRTYVARKITEGKTPREAIRCLKRQLSNVVYRRMMLDLRGAESAA